MRKSINAALAAALIAAVAVCGIALAAKPRDGFYCAKFDCMQVDKNGKEVNNFQGRCPASNNPKFFFHSYFIPINGKGKFHYDKLNVVNTPDGGTLSKQSRVTIDGKFVSKKEATGTYQLHKGSCKKVTFDAKRQSG